MIAIGQQQYRNDRREHILVLLYQYNQPIPIAVIIKLLAYESQTDAATPLLGLVQDGQVIVSCRRFFNTRESLYSLSRLGSRAAGALVSDNNVPVLKVSKYGHVGMLIARHNIFQFDVSLGMLVCQTLPSREFSTSEFQVVFDACSQELQRRFNRGELLKGNCQDISDILSLTGNHRVHGSRRETVVYAHNLLKALLVQGQLRKTSLKTWELQPSTLSAPIKKIT